MLKEDIEQVNAYLLDQLKRFPYFPSAPLVVLSPHTLGEEFPLEEHSFHYALQALETRGDWDRIPPLGRHKDVWFHVPSLNAERVEPSVEDVKLGKIALKAHGTRPHTLTGTSSRGEVMDVVARMHLFHLNKACKNTAVQITPTSAHSVAMTLAAFYLPHAGFTSLSYKQVALSGGGSVKVVRNAVKILAEAGLWGVVKGVGRRKTRFYPLFNDESHEAFQALIEG